MEYIPVRRERTFMGKYIEEAREFYGEAQREFVEGKRENDLIKLRDASEKAWGAVVLGTHELFAKRSIPIPKSHKGRRACISG